MNRANGSLPEQVFAAYFYTEDSAREHIRQCLDRAAALAEALRFSASMAGQSGFDVMDRRALEDLASMLKGEVAASRAILDHAEDLGRMARSIGPVHEQQA